MAYNSNSYNLKKINLITKSIQSVYPAYLLLLIFFPEILGIVIDYELFDNRVIVINLIWIAVFTIPIVLTKNKILYRFTATLFFIIGFIQSAHWIIIGGPVTITSLLVISNTYSEEIMEFTSLKASLNFLLILPIFFIFIKSLQYKIKIEISKINNITLITIALISVIFISENALNGRLIRKGVPSIAKVSYSFFEKLQLFKEAMKDSKPRELVAQSMIPNEKQTFVLIIGESNNRRHMSLYGSEAETTPKLKSRNDLVVFNDVVSPYSSTVASVLSILTQTNLEKKVEIINNIDVFDVFHSAGFKTFWISNQCPIGVWDNQITQFARKADDCRFVNMTSNSSYEATYMPSFDEKVIAPFSEVLNNEVAKKLIIIHLIGNHSSYKKRYPSAFKIFEGDGTDKGNTIAEYRNSLTYTDYVVDSIINIVSEQSKLLVNNLSALVYLSDHGENVYDHNDKVGHDFNKKVPKANVEIPFLTWTSPGYKTRFEEKTNQIFLNKNKPYVTDDLFHSMIDLNMIKTEYLIESRSVFHPTFNDKRKRILCDGNDYDN